MVTVFVQTDKIMMTLMINETATGYYSAAVACAGITNFVIGAIIDSARPVILEAKKVAQAEYEKGITVLYSAIIYLALAQSLVMTIFARPLITILYGAEYLPASNILQVLVWYTTFSYLGGAKDIWILAEEKQKYLVVLNFAGAVSNVILNLILIPMLGATGAAIASLITQFFTNIAMMFVIKALRRNGVLIWRATNPKVLLCEMRKLTLKERK
jgi:O-antigen/teichoic acid export membrane protein